VQLIFECPLWKFMIDTDKPFREVNITGGEFDPADAEFDEDEEMAFGFQGGTK
jgi:hypothetical protein